MASAPAPAPGVAVVVVFDFDRTIIDWDSDDWVITKLGAADAFQRLRPTMRWNPLMDRMMAELHARGKTAEDIRDCLRSAPLDAHVISAIKTASSLGCDLKVVSDANTFFIETVLAHHSVLGCFSEISTNPASVDADGRLRISPFHDSSSAPHGCSLCPENMCKGKIIEKIQDRSSVCHTDQCATLISAKNQHFIYIGDGKGDYCPSLKLGEGDYVMPKENYPLWKLTCSNKNLLKAEVHPWNSGEELEKTLLKLVSKIITPPAQVSPFDCSKCEMSKPASTEVGHNQALHVPH
ncbi:Inorganic pyrophosphatase 3 [Dichanthelium oligosanthes]|uniref:Inorganic pyrophosphatase 3 n=1 Tax=Dichanthelium oligosanthes TaxID=888268 RepID=A0A1E5V834_9POAL|nr:Inorganic pyrophosphatase 3 [Dichanthelium oligosanthes]